MFAFQVTLQSESVAKFFLQCLDSDPTAAVERLLQMAEGEVSNAVSTRMETLDQLMTLTDGP